MISVRLPPDSTSLSRRGSANPTAFPPVALTDLLASSHMAGRLTSGSAETTNLYGQIDRDKVHGLNVDQPSTSASAAAAASEARTGLAGEGRGRGKGEAKEMIKEWDARGDESVWVESQDGASPDLS